MQFPHYCVIEVFRATELQLDVLKHGAQVAVEDAVRGNLGIHPHHAVLLFDRLNLFDLLEQGLRLGTSEVLLGEVVRELHTRALVVLARSLRT